MEYIWALYGSYELLQIHPACEEDQYECNDGTCIELDRKCDSHPDCNGGDDEENCDPPEGKIVFQDEREPPLNPIILIAALYYC